MPTVTTTERQRAKDTRRRYPVVLLGFLVWTVLVAVALWWLLRSESRASVLILREGDALQPQVSEKFRAWFKADLGLQRIYPWLLFWPYVALMAWRFPLERGRLRLNAPVNAGACLVFLLASHFLSGRISESGAKVVFYNSQHELGPPGNRVGTNITYLHVIRSEASDLLEERFTGTLQTPQAGSVTGIIDKSEFQLPHALNSEGLSNMVSRMNLPAMKPPPGWAGPRKFSVLSWALDLLAYSAIIGLAHSVHFYRRFREREHRALVLEASLVNARLNTLRAQLQPHFLFNSLNAIAALLRRDPRLAESTLMSLSELLRLALSQSERQEVALSEELALVQHYLEIQQTRFGDKLQVQQNIEPACQTCRIPTLLLQPLVENAIRHGLEPRETTGTVRVTAHRAGKRLVLSVEDNGVGLSENCEHHKKQPDAPTGNTTGTGIGLKNLRARLEALYGTEQKLELSIRPEGGVCVRVELPWQEAVEKPKIPSDAL